MKKIFFTNARIVDGTGAPAIEQGTVVFEKPADQYQKGKILYVGTPEGCAIAKEPTDECVDMSGYTVLPGLFNVHVHLWATSPKYSFICDPFGTPYRTLLYYRHMAEALMAGVTTIRSVGGSDDIDIAVRDAIDMGMVWGPRLITCGPPLIPHGGHCWRTRGGVLCSGPDEFVRNARIEMGKGVDQIKLYFTGGAGGSKREGMLDRHITDAEAKAVCEVAHMNSRIVAAHLSNDEGTRAAVRNGVDCVEHAYRINRETAKIMADHNVWYVPTLAISDMAKSEDAEKKLQPHVLERLAAVHPIHMNSARYAFEAGVKKICCGTDTLPSDIFDGTYATNYEVELLTEIGLSPLEAIKAATYNSAELCKLEKVTGSLKEGLAGDIIAVKGAPDKNIKDLRNLSMVVRDCRVVWSEIPEFEKEMSFSPLVPGTDKLGGSSKSWNLP